MKPLTRLERRALGLASNKAGAEITTARITEGKLVTTTVANRMARKGLAVINLGRLRITAEGQRVLKLPLPPEPETYLRIRDGLTTRRDLAARDEPAVMRDELHPDWRNRAEAHRKLSRADLDAARLSGLDHPEERLRELRRMAAERGVDVKDELRYVAHSLRILERKVRKEAA